MGCSKKGGSCKEGRKTNNPFLNFLREYRKKHCGKRVTVIAKEGACEWKKMDQCQKEPYIRMALSLQKRKCGRSRRGSSRSRRSSRRSCGRRSKRSSRRSSSKCSRRKSRHRKRSSCSKKRSRPSCISRFIKRIKRRLKRGCRPAKRTCKPKRKPKRSGGCPKKCATLTSASEMSLNSVSSPVYVIKDSSNYPESYSSKSEHDDVSQYSDDHFSTTKSQDSSTDAGSWPWGPFSSYRFC